MADLSNVTFQPQNPDVLFSPDQWLNKFSLFNDNPLPWPSSYAGYPTDAMGNPIGGGPPATRPAAAAPAAAGSSTPGTTINSNPSIYASANPDMSRGIYSAGSPNGMGLTMGQPYALSSFAGPNAGGNQNQRDAAGLAALMGFDPSRMNGMPQQQQQAAAPPPAAAAPGGLTYPQVLSLLANPGKVTTPGANVPVGPSSQPGGGANNAFLGQAQGKSGMNQNFLSALAAIQGRGRG